MDWIKFIDIAVSKLKKDGRKAYYGFSISLTQSEADGIKQHFEKEGMAVIVKKCPRNLYDVIITW
jgi:hypothetical protein